MAELQEVWNSALQLLDANPVLLLFLLLGLGYLLGNISIAGFSVEGLRTGTRDQSIVGVGRTPG